MKVIPWILVGALAAALACVLLSGHGSRGDGSGLRYDTVVVRDTVRDTVPVPVRVTRLRVDTVRLAVVRCDTVVVRDSVLVEVPITRREYRTDDYHAIVSGFRPSLDFMEVFRRTSTVTVERKPKRWGLGLQAGYGWPHGAYIGVGASYNLLIW